MSKRKIINNLNSDFSVKYYKEDKAGKPVFEKELAFKASDKEKEIDRVSDNYWLVLSVKKKDGCTVMLSGNQVLDYMTIKALSNGGPNLTTVVKIVASASDVNVPNEEDDIIVDPPKSVPIEG
ncbi:MAG: hypothetical protein WEA58_00285 [Balneolaceae bacterium]